MSSMNQFLVLVAPHRPTITHNLASLTTSPPSEEAYFMVGKYTQLNPYYRYFPTTSGNDFDRQELYGVPVSTVRLWTASEMGWC